MARTEVQHGRRRARGQAADRDECRTTTGAEACEDKTKTEESDKTGERLRQRDDNFGNRDRPRRLNAGGERGAMKQGGKYPEGNGLAPPHNGFALAFQNNEATDQSGSNEPAEDQARIRQRTAPDLSGKKPDVERRQGGTHEEESSTNHRSSLVHEVCPLVQAGKPRVSRPELSVLAADCGKVRSVITGRHRGRHVHRDGP